MTNDKNDECGPKGMWVIGYGSLMFKPIPKYQFRVNGYLVGYIRRFWQSSSDHRGTPEAPGRVVTLISIEDLKHHEVFHDDLCMFELKNSKKHFDESSFMELTEKSDIGSVRREIHALKEEDLKVWGCAYYVAPEHVAATREYLDIREQDGYTTHEVPFHILSDPCSNPEMKEVLNQLPKNANGDSYINSVIYIGTLDNPSFVGPEDIEKTAVIIATSKGPSGMNSEYLFKLCNAVKELDSKGRSKDFYLEKLEEYVKNRIT